MRRPTERASFEFDLHSAPVCRRASGEPFVLLDEMLPLLTHLSKTRGEIMLEILAHHNKHSTVVNTRNALQTQPCWCLDLRELIIHHCKLFIMCTCWNWTCASTIYQPWQSSNTKPAAGHSVRAISSINWLWRWLTRGQLVSVPRGERASRLHTQGTEWFHTCHVWTG